MKTVNIYYACSLPPRETRVLPVLVLIIILVVYGLAYPGSGRAAMIMIIVAVVTAAADELVRAAVLPTWSRTV